MSLALSGKKKEEAEKFYNEVFDVLLAQKVPFMIGGTFAFNAYTGLDRETGDIDIMTTVADYPKLLKTLTKAGFSTELSEIELKWLAKVHKDNFYTDIIFAERNGLNKIDESWIKRARPGEVLGHKVLLEPIEEMIRSKLYVQNRHRNDLGDVVHLILRQGGNVDWKILWEKTRPHWELLSAALLLFLFVYPSERANVPEWLVKKLVKEVEKRFDHPPTKDRVTRGLLLSNDYEVGVSKWGFQPIHELK